MSSATRASPPASFTGPAPVDDASDEGRLAIRVSQELLRAWLDGAWRAADLAGPHRLELDRFGWIGTTASARIARPMLHLYAADDGALRIALDIRCALHFAVPSPAMRIELEGDVLALPELDPTRDGGLRISIDFAQAALDDVRASPTGVASLWTMDPLGLGLRSEDRLAELAHYAAKRVLARLGTQSLTIPSERLSPWLPRGPRGSRSDPARDRGRGRRAPSSHARRRRAIDSPPPRSRRAADAGVGRGRLGVRIPGIRR